MKDEIMTGGPHRLPGKPGHLKELPLPKFRPFVVGERHCPVCGYRDHAVNYLCARKTTPCGDPRPHLHDQCSKCGVDWMTSTYENRSLWKRTETQRDAALFIAVSVAIGLAIVLAAQ